MNQYKRRAPAIIEYAPERVVCECIFQVEPIEISVMIVMGFIN